MSEPHPNLSAVEPPVVAPPPPFTERRVAFRRAADRLAHEETLLLARSLDVLASGADAESRLAGLLDLLAETARAERAAVLAEGRERRIAVSVAPGESADAASALAAWLDAAAPRSRAQRAASAPATVAIVTGRPRPTRSRREQPAALPAIAGASEPAFAYLPIPSAGAVVLGFAFGDETVAAALDRRLPPQLARHAAVALALVTEQLVAEREVAALRARDAERARFVSTVAHELRTPLTGLSGYLELILGGQVADPADERDFLERSQQIVETMGALVGDLLELSRLESGSLRLEAAPFSVAETMTRVIAGLEPVAHSRDVELTTTLPPRLRGATGDRRRVEQILTNLAANAVKFSPAGSRVELEARFEGSVAVVSVRDEGAGIAADDRARIFDRFYRLGGHERITGTGLGLPIARDLARAMGADLDVASVPGSGSTFILVLPGPSAVDPDVVAAALVEALSREEIRLEERAVLRAIAAAPRGPSGAGSGSSPDGAVVPDRFAGGPAGRPGARPRLRSLEGLAPRSAETTSA